MAALFIEDETPRAVHVFLSALCQLTVIFPTIENKFQESFFHSISDSSEYSCIVIYLLNFLLYFEVVTSSAQIFWFLIMEFSCFLLSLWIKEAKDAQTVFTISPLGLKETMDVLNIFRKIIMSLIKYALTLFRKYWYFFNGCHCKGWSLFRRRRLGKLSMFTEKWENFCYVVATQNVGIN